MTSCVRERENEKFTGVSSMKSSKWFFFLNGNEMDGVVVVQKRVAFQGNSLELCHHREKGFVHSNSRTLTALTVLSAS